MVVTFSLCSSVYGCGWFFMPVRFCFSRVLSALHMVMVTNKPATCHVLYNIAGVTGKHEELVFCFQCLLQPIKFLKNAKSSLMKDPNKISSFIIFQWDLKFLSWFQKQLIWVFRSLLGGDTFFLVGGWSGPSKDELEAQPGGGMGHYYNYAICTSCLGNRR